MSDVVTLGRRVSTLDVSPQFANYSKVIIHTSDDTAIEVGNDTGRTLEIDNPFGTQAMAQNMLNSLKGFQYQPFNASGAILDPAAEIGDAANIRGVYGGIYSRSRTFGKLMKANIAAPQDEEIDHEYKFETPERREFKRQIGEVKASLLIEHDRITAEVTARENGDSQLQSSITQTASEIRASVVSQVGGRNATFGWALTSSGHRWYAGNKEVMAVTASGLSVVGTVTATSGKIGNFNIGASAIWNNISAFGGSQSSGVYLGTNGIQLGQHFKVDSSGHVSAVNMTLSGTLKIGGTNITADALRQGAQQSYNNYGSWNGTTSTVNTNGGYWSGGANYGYNYNNATNSTSGSYPGYFQAESIVGNRGGTLGAHTSGDSVVILGYGVSWKTATLRTPSGGTVTINYLGR